MTYFNKISLVIGVPSLILAYYLFSVSSDHDFTEVEWALWALSGLGGVFGILFSLFGFVRN